MKHKNKMYYTKNKQVCCKEMTQVKKTTVIGFVGATLDQGSKADRWHVGDQP